MTESLPVDATARLLYVVPVVLASVLAHVTMGTRRYLVAVLAAYVGALLLVDARAAFVLLAASVPVLVVDASTRAFREAHPIPATVVVAFAGGGIGGFSASLLAGAALAPAVLCATAAAQLAVVGVTLLAVMASHLLAAETGVASPDRIRVSTIAS